jgi:hypothetical protein
MAGWIKLHRKLTENPLWANERFSKGQAWIDLLLLANHKDSKIIIGNQLIICKRGQCALSVNSYQARWGWSRQQIRGFFTLLESLSMIERNPTNKTTIITICNYESYQGEQPSDNHQITIAQPSNNHQITTNKNDKNVKNVNNEKNKERELDENSKKIDFKKIESSFTEFCPALPQIKSMHENRKKAIQSIIKKEGIQKLIEAFRLAGQSDFLTGQNDRSWTADFDWILKPQNFYKILEGKYTNPTKHEKFKPNDPRASQSEGWGIPL